MTIVVLSVFVIRTCGSENLRADSKSGVLRVLPQPMNLSWSNVFAHLEALTAPFFGASPDLFVRRDSSALD